MSHGESPDYGLLGIWVYPEPPWVARDFRGSLSSHGIQPAHELVKSGLETLEEHNVTRHAFKVHMTAADTQALRKSI